MDENKELHELLGLCWHEVENGCVKNYATGQVVLYCTKCKRTIKICENDMLNLDYAADPRLVLREMMKQEGWVEFQSWCFIGVLNFDDSLCYGVPVDLILDTTGKLRDIAIEWLKDIRKR